jgi:hypothetical protein
MPDYRVYILGREGLGFLRVADFSSDHADDATFTPAVGGRVDSS